MKNTSSPTVRFERLQAHVGLVTLDRPEARNAVNAAVAVALQAVVEQTEQDPSIRAVVLTGAGHDVFCAGADLKEVAAGRASALFTEAAGFAGFVDGRRTKPWIAAVNGKALAGGFEIVLACDMVVASADASFGLPEVSRGLLAAAGGLYRLPRALPRHLALELVTTGDPLGADRAAHHGFVNHLVPRGAAVERAVALAERIARNAPISVRESLLVAREACDVSETEARVLTKTARDRVANTDDYREGPRAFVEKRDPVWKGR